MEKFYKLTIIIALGALIICLIGIGILMQYQNAGMKFPLHPNECPDLWDVNAGNTECIRPADGNNTGSTTANSGNITKSAYPTICEKKKWATTNGVNWDGVSNYNGKC